VIASRTVFFAPETIGINAPDVSDEEQTISSGKREYKCENDRLEIFHETEPNFVFTRADELIPTPIPTETNP